MKVSVTTKVTSETRSRATGWTGTLAEPVSLGTVVAARGHRRARRRDGRAGGEGDRAVLVLSISSIELDGKTFGVKGSTDSLIAGSTRTRNVGAVAGGAAAGALIGKAVSGSGKGALIGGCSAARRRPARSRNSKTPGRSEGRTKITFTVDETTKTSCSVCGRCARGGRTPSAPCFPARLSRRPGPPPLAPWVRRRAIPRRTLFQRLAGRPGGMGAARGSETYPMPCPVHRPRGPIPEVVRMKSHRFFSRPARCSCSRAAAKVASRCRPSRTAPRPTRSR